MELELDAERVLKNPWLWDAKTLQDAERLMQQRQEYRDAEREDKERAALQRGRC